MSSLSGDFHLAARRISRWPAGSAATVLILALGTGAAAAAFAVLDATVLRPLPFEDAGALCTIRSASIAPSVQNGRVSIGDFVDLRERAAPVADIAAYGFASLELLAGEPREVPTAAVSANLFRLLRVQPFLGRGFLADEETPGRDQEVILSHALWRQVFGGDRHAIGRRLRLSGDLYVVVGVMPSWFHFPAREVDLWSPMAIDRAHLLRQRRGLGVVARLAPGVALGRLRGALRAAAGELALRHVEDAGWTLEASLWREKMAGEAAPVAVSLLCATALFYLIALANAASLLLGREAARSAEVALRRALGATSLGLWREITCQQLLLALLGAALGLLFAGQALSWARVLRPAGVERLGEAALGWPVLVFSLALAGGGSILLGAAAVRQARGAGLGSKLREVGRGIVSGRRRVQSGDILIVTQILLAVPLVSGAGLLVRSYEKASQVELGFDARRLLVASFDLRSARYPDPAAVNRFLTPLLARIANLPGVVASGTSSAVPMNAFTAVLELPFTVAGSIEAPSTGEKRAEIRVVSPLYFPTLGVPVRAGRGLSPADRAGAPLVAMVNEAMVRRFWPGGEPVGQRLTFDFQGPATYEIVGVVGNVRQHGPEREPGAEIFLSSLQRPLPYTSVAIRTRQEPERLGPSVRRLVRELDPEQVVDLATMDDNVAAAMAGRRVISRLVVAFAALALVLAETGVYSAASNAVVRRRREIGLRIALGADRGRVLLAASGRQLAFIAVGLAAGALAAFAGARLLRGFLFDIAATDAIAFGAALALLTAAALVGSYLPARRATAINPLDTLGHE